MKTRKMIPLMALAIMVGFALSSCDAMLESLFPNETNKGQVQVNSITVTVNLDKGSFDAYYGLGAWQMHKVWVVLEKYDSVSNKYKPVENGYQSSYLIGDANDYAAPARAQFRYDGIPDFGDYQLWAWFDYYSNGDWSGNYWNYPNDPSNTSVTLQSFALPLAGDREILFDLYLP